MPALYTWIYTQHLSTYLLVTLHLHLGYKHLEGALKCPTRSGSLTASVKACALDFHKMTAPEAIHALRSRTMRTYHIDTANKTGSVSAYSPHLYCRGV